MERCGVAGSCPEPLLNRKRLQDLNLREYVQRVLPILLKPNPFNLRLIHVFTARHGTHIGRSLRVRGDGFAAAHTRPNSSMQITREGATFNRTNSGFDAYRPTQVVKSSSLGFR
jgi:hypothetical protein